MVVWLVMVTLAQTPPVGVVQGGDAKARVRRGDEVRPLTPGMVLRAKDTVESGPSGWVDIGLAHRTKLRLAAASRVRVTPSEVRLLKGRLWVERFASQGAALPVRLRAERTMMTMNGPGKVGVEIHRTLGDWWAVGIGEISVESALGASVTVPEGHEVHLPPTEVHFQGPRPGGAAVLTLFAQAAQARLGTDRQFRRFLLTRVAEVQPVRAREGAPRRRVPMRSGAEVLGADGGPAGALLEDSLRPPPFLEDEVPLKGPNVRVEVDFEE